MRTLAGATVVPFEPTLAASHSEIVDRDAPRSEGASLPEGVDSERLAPYRYFLGSLLLIPLAGPGDFFVRSISPVLAQNTTKSLVARSSS